MNLFLFDMLVALQWYLLTAVTALVAALVTLWLRGRLPGMTFWEGLVETCTVFVATWIYQFVTFMTVMGFARRIGRRVGDIDPFIIGLLLVMIFIGIYCWTMREHLDFEAPDYAIWFGLLFVGLGLGIPLIYTADDAIAAQTAKTPSISMTTQSLAESLMTSGYVDCLDKVIQLQGEIYEVYPESLEVLLPLPLSVEVFAGDEEFQEDVPGEEEMAFIVCAFHDRFRGHFEQLKVGQHITIRGLSRSPFCDVLTHCRLVRIDRNAS